MLGNVYYSKKFDLGCTYDALEYNGRDFRIMFLDMGLCFRELLRMGGSKRWNDRITLVKDLGQVMITRIYIVGNRYYL